MVDSSVRQRQNYELKVQLEALATQKGLDRSSYAALYQTLKAEGKTSFSSVRKAIIEEGKLTRERAM